MLARWVLYSVQNTLPSPPPLSFYLSLSLSFPSFLSLFLFGGKVPPPPLDETLVKSECMCMTL